MPKITIIAPDGTSTIAEVPPDLSIMRVAVDLNIPGIRAECGGACACATCLVVVDPIWAAKLPPPTTMEQSMLGDEEEVAGGVPRLSCQLKVTEKLDGMIVQVSKSFY